MQRVFGYLMLPFALVFVSAIALACWLSPQYERRVIQALWGRP